MIRVLVIAGCAFLLAGCERSDTQPVPHNRVIVESETLDSVLFTFTQSDRFSRAELAHGISIELSNQSSHLLETDFELVVDYYDDGWIEMGSIDFFTRTHAYSLERNHRLRQTVYAEHFEDALDSGRYRLRIEYLLTDEETDEQETHSIGAVFWVHD
ncbi:MAG: hypothetical protein JJU16_07225 [Alkalibacterium sp.]|nr:hypothetical protein [Alkalibacterium sp.]